MNQEEKKGSSEPKPRYVWDPKKLAWVETTEPEIQEPATERAAVEPKPEEVLRSQRSRNLRRRGLLSNRSPKRSWKRLR